jgi:hypothetical protein
MPMIHVARDGAKLGEFTLEQIQEGLRTGQFRSNDLGWQPGMADWRPLSELAGAAAPPTAGASPPLPLATAAGASAGSSGAGLPWEHRAQLGLFKAWFETVSLLITKPSEAFTIMRPEGGLTDPLLFGLIGGSLGGIVSIIFQGLLQSIPGIAGRNDAFNSLGISLWVILLIYAVMMPLLVTVGLFIGGAILHLCLMLVGGANRSFETTFRVACFASGAANLFSMIPFCGGIIALVYHIVLECIGLSRAHPTTTGKALMAIFLPMIVCCGLIVLLVILLGGFGAIFNHQH